LILSFESLRTRLFAAWHEYFCGDVGGRQSLWAPKGQSKLDSIRISPLLGASQLVGEVVEAVGCEVERRVAFRVGLVSETGAVAVLVGPTDERRVEA